MGATGFDDTFALSRSRRLQRLAHTIGISGNNGKVGAGGLIRLRAMLLPIAQGADWDAEYTGEFRMRMATLV